VYRKGQITKGDGNLAGVLLFSKMACSHDLNKWHSAKRFTACYTFPPSTQASRAVHGASAQLKLEDWKACFLGNKLEHLGQCAQLWPFTAAFPCGGYNIRMSRRCWRAKHGKGLSCYKSEWMKRNCRQTCFGGKASDTGISRAERVWRARHIRSKTHRRWVQFFQAASAAQ